MTDGFDYDVIIVGSGFGGSPTALRLVEKGYSVLMLEKGSELGPDQFPKSNWNLRRWMWAPWLGARGLFKMTFFRHVTVLSGVGVGGGSLVYACTHPVPNDSFFHTGSWAGLAEWKEELAPYYERVKGMLGVNATPMLTPPDRILKAIAEDRGQPDAFHSTDVAVYFGDAGKQVDDPYFGGEGPPRTGCIRCGGCMLGCRHGAKNTLDKNYLWLARKLGLTLHADTEVTAIRPLPDGGYRVEAKHGRHPLFRKRRVITAKQVVLAGGVLGTVELLAKMKRDPLGLPQLSERLGSAIRTNSESLIGVVTPRRDVDYSKGVAIGSIYEIDEHSHLEPVRYPAGSGAFRAMLAPHVAGENGLVRLLRMAGTVVRHPLRFLRTLFVRDLAKQSAILLYMRTADGTLEFVRRWWGGLGSRREAGPAPTASIPQATELAHAFGDKMGGTPFSLVTETALNIPTTAHILGGCCMGRDRSTGVIDAEHRVFGYEGLYVIDGSAISSNPGVNPSLTIAALAERAASRFPDKPGRARAPFLPVES
ncbi:MAG: GMC family oxidoreductase [Myxococcales bacterium]|nr:GMC family oxidoreductase [Myxococcales bacterium]MCB9718142.1 GMC family oxidoreductase [Myxococcales bacterium]